MDTPICDFARSYAVSGAMRLHMPGHKGFGPLGVEALDITEIPGADSLYEADGIIARSEDNASALFGCKTFYSTEGSSLCIRAMLYLALLHARKCGRRPLIAAGRNAHKTFLSAAALLDLDLCWLLPEADSSYLACRIDPRALERVLEAEKPAAVYVTSPDYLGNVADIAALSTICRRHDALLLVDNAHGAYLRFLPESHHPIDLGADACCDSAHKTLPVLTGGAYLHLSPRAPQLYFDQARNALALFGSTSPSYLIMQSLDAANPALAQDFPGQLAAFVPTVAELKKRLQTQGHQLCGNEPLKLTLRTKAWGYTGQEFAGLLMDQNIVVEFADPDFVVMMLSPFNGESGISELEAALAGIPRRPAIEIAPPPFRAAERVMSVREACFSPSETLPVETCFGRILAAASVGCPPAVPILICGERIDEHAAECFRYYGIDRCSVVR